MWKELLNSVEQFFYQEQEYLLLTLFLIGCLIQIFYYFRYYAKMAFFQDSKTRKAKPEPVSVIICARNEAENLDKFLPSMLTQGYPDYEVIVVNDCSTDNTEEIIGKYLKKYPRLKTTTINKDHKFSHGKKLAVTVGIKAAKNELLLFIDADCAPVTNNWITLMQSHFTEKTEIVLGYGGYFRQKGLLNNYIRFDTLYIAMQYFGLALSGKPYMGVGRNLAYRKTLFFKNKGFASHLKLESGDDDLFINDTATQNNTAIEFSLDSHTRSEAETLFSGWLRQKRRHLTTGRYYKKTHKRILATEILSRFLMYGLFPVVLVQGRFAIFAGILFSFREIAFLIIIKKAMNKLNEKGFLISALFYDIFSIIINFILYIINLFRPGTNKWK